MNARQVQNRPWSPVPKSYVNRDQLPEISPIVGDGIGYAANSDGSGRMHHTDAMRRLLDGKPVFYATFADCRIDEDVTDARALLLFRLDA